MVWAGKWIYLIHCNEWWVIWIPIYEIPFPAHNSYPTPDPTILSKNRSKIISNSWVYYLTCPYFYYLSCSYYLAVSCSYFSSCSYYLSFSCSSYSSRSYLSYSCSYYLSYSPAPTPPAPAYPAHRCDSLHAQLSMNCDRCCMRPE